MYQKLISSIAAVIVALGGVGAAHALSIDVGEFTLVADTPDQTVTISVTGGDEVAAVDLFAEIFTDEVGPTPIFTDIELITDTIFADVVTAVQTDDTLEPTRLYSFVDTNETTPAAGTLVTLTVDTTGVSSGNFELRLAGVANGAADTQFFDLNGAILPTSIVNGTLSVLVPEPSIAAIAAVGLLLRRRRR